ncbi:MAG: phosphate-starvation-inducible PsiE family protein [Gallionella sp.]|nr:phosphate-starvation-inducible PsiE family protein [Gallionella sp.]
MISTAMKIFDRAVNLIFGVLLLFITSGIVIGVVHLFLRLGDLARHTDITRHYVEIVSDVLTLFVLIELSRSLVSHFNEHRLRMTFIVDAGIVFVLREIMIKLFEHKISPDEIYALSALLFVLGILRTASVLVFQREKQLLSNKRSQGSGRPPLDSIHKASNPVSIIPD